MGQVKTPSQRGRSSRNKGADALGMVVTRNLSQTRDAGCDSISIPGCVIECKRVEGAFQKAWMEQAVVAAANGEMPVVFYRCSRKPWVAAFRIGDLLGAGFTGMAHVGFDGAVMIIREKVNGGFKHDQ